jgi:hypothetical protein
MLAGWLLAVGLINLPGYNPPLDFFFTGLRAAIFVFGLISLGPNADIFVRMRLRLDELSRAFPSDPANCYGGLRHQLAGQQTIFRKRRALRPFLNCVSPNARINIFFWRPSP